MMMKNVMLIDSYVM